MSHSFLTQSDLQKPSAAVQVVIDLSSFQMMIPRYSLAGSRLYGSHACIGIRTTVHDVSRLAKTTGKSL